MVLIQMLSDREKDYLAQKMNAMEKPRRSNSSGILSRYEGKRAKEIKKLREELNESKDDSRLRTETEISALTAEIIALKIEIQKDVEFNLKSMEEERKEKLQQERKAALDKIFPPPYRL